MLPFGGKTTLKGAVANWMLLGFGENCIFQRGNMKSTFLALKGIFFNKKTQIRNFLTLRQMVVLQGGPANNPEMRPWQFRSEEIEHNFWALNDYKTISQHLHCLGGTWNLSWQLIFHGGKKSQTFWRVLNWSSNTPLKTNYWNLKLLFFPDSRMIELFFRAYSREDLGSLVGLEKHVFLGIRKTNETTLIRLVNAFPKSYPGTCIIRSSPWGSGFD